MPLIVVNDLLFKWRFPRRVGGGGWGKGIGVVCGAVFVPFVDGLEGVQL